MTKSSDALFKALGILLGIAVLCSILKEKLYGSKKHEIIIAGHHINSNPFMGAMNDVFGPAVDSVKACECFIPLYYECIKNDSEKVQELEEYGLINMELLQKDSLKHFFINCITSNVLDTTYKLNLSKFRNNFIKLLNDSLQAHPSVKINIDGACNCLIQHLDGRVTIKEFYSNDYYNTDSAQKIINNCFMQNIIKD